MKLLILALVLIIFISGCTGMPDFLQGIFGRPEVKELPPDVIVVENIKTLPSPPVNAGDRFTIIFEIVNKDENEEMKNVIVELFDYGLCEPQDLEEQDWEKSTTTPYTYSRAYNFSPLETEFVEWSFKAPENRKIAYLTAKCPIRFKVSYSYRSTSQVVVGVINQDERMRRLRAGQTISFIPNQTVGRGPVKIYFDFGASLPVITDSTLPVFITVEDKGTGLLEKIEAGYLLLKVHRDFTNPTTCEKFKFDAPEDDYNVYKNTNDGDIEMIKRKSSLIRCSFDTPSEDEVEIEQTYFLYSTIDYSYDLNYEVDIQVKPLLGV